MKMKTRVTCLLTMAIACYVCSVNADIVKPPLAEGPAKYTDEEDMKPTESSMRHQSPIDIRTKGWRKNREIYMVQGDNSFAYQYGGITFKNAKAVGEGAVFFFDEDQQGFFKTSAVHIFDHKKTEMTFIPKQFHFHSGTTHADPSNMGSEHTYNGKHFDLEMHIVHLNMDTETQDFFKAAVVGVMFKAVDSDKLTYADVFLRKLFSGEVVDFERAMAQHLDLVHRFVYRGSLTTPPYSEYLLWNMVARIPRINYETLKLFRHTVKVLDKATPDEKLVGMANRDVQPQNGRKIYEIVEKDIYHEE